MKMNLQCKLASMEKAIWDVVSTTLSSIRTGSLGHDYVLDDKDDNFKTLFLDCAKSNLLTAYNAYVIQAEWEYCNRADKARNEVANLTLGTVVSELTLKDDDDIETVVSELTLKDDEDIATVGSNESESLLLSLVGSAANSTNPFISSVSMPSPSDDDHYPNSLQLSDEDISENQKNAELKMQNRFRSILIVSGLPTRRGDKNSLLSLFTILCNYMGFAIEPNEIANIESHRGGMTVTFHSRDLRKRDLLIRSRRIKNVKSDDVLHLLPGEISTPVTINRKETIFYYELCQLAKDYVKKKQIHSYQIRSPGLGIKFTRNSTPIYVRSQNELKQQIVLNETKLKDLVGGPAVPPVPPRHNKNN